MVQGSSYRSKVAFTFILSFVSMFANAQCIIQSTDYTCIDDIINFTVNSTKTISTASWKFGDGNSGSTVSPAHQYASAGTFDVTVSVSFSDGSTCDTSKEITVYAPPVIDLTIDNSSYFCFTGNKICLLDKTTSGNSSVQYTRRIILWGDGGKTENQNPGNNDKICYTYKQPGNYEITMEATNDKGCKAKKELKVEVLFDFPGVFNYLNGTKDCDYDELRFIYDTSWSNNYGNLLDRAIYDYGDGGRDTLDRSYGKIVRHKFTKAGTYKVTAILQFKNGCETRYERQVRIDLDRIEINHTKFDTTLCYPDYFEFSHPFVASADYSWTALDSNMKIVENFGSDRSAFFFPEYPGKHYIEIQLKRGQCISKKLDSVYSIGVRARPFLLNKTQCAPEDTVYFCDSSVSYRTGPLTFLWKFGDKRADSCYIDTKAGQHVGSNCNFSRDRSSKHFYDSVFCDEAWLTVMDTLHGCVDSAKAYASIKKPLRQDFTFDVDPPCTGVLVGYGTSACIDKDNILINYDSACGKDRFTSWLPEFAYSKLCDTTGWVTTGIISKAGDPKIYGSCDTNDFHIDPSRVCYDTFWYHNAVHLTPPPDISHSYKFEGCLPSTLSVKFLNRNQPNINRIEMSIGSSGKITVDTIWPHPDSTNIPNLLKTFTKSGRYEIFIQVFNDSGCYRTITVRENVGFYNNFTFNRPICPGTEVHFRDSIRYWNDPINYWRTPSVYPERIYWDFDDGQGFATQGPGPTYIFDKEGTYNVRMVAVDRNGCSDTTTIPVEVNNVKAGIKNITKKLLCEDIIQLFDSSYLKDTVYDDIVKYYWDFGDGKTPSFLEDPYHFYSTYGEFTVTHVVENTIGCRDTAHATILIEGPEPQFDILSDTVGCAPYTVEFKNNSIRATEYIWDFGDPPTFGNKYSTKSDTNVSFTYNKPGVYDIFLFAADSVVNPNNNNQVYYCNATFPDTNADFVARRRIIVLPVPEVDFTAEGVFCTNRKIKLTDNSDTIYSLYRWFWDTGSAISQDSSVDVVIDQPGKVSIAYRPTYTPTGPYQRECFDTAYKEIDIYTNNNKFSFVKDSMCPTFYFNADVGPGDDFMWDFGHPSSGPDNVSFQRNAEHRFAPDLGTFEVCLISTTVNGCEDTVCQMVESDHNFSLFVPNIITPNDDQLNDLLEIEIEGEDYYELSIYNRWGERVYYSDRDYPATSSLNWDGTSMSNGKPCPAGTYFYILKFREGCIDGAKKEKMQGTITLVRDND